MRTRDCFERTCSVLKSCGGSHRSWTGLTATLFVCLLIGASVSMAEPPPPLGELEEPGEIERRPVGKADETSKPDTKEAETTGDEAEDGETDEAVLQPLDEEPHEDEAVEILPDSEAVDETIEEPTEEQKQREEAAEASEAAKPKGPGPPEKPDAKEADRPAQSASEPRWRIRWQNSFIVERVDDPAYQFLFGGRVQNDWGGYFPDNDLKRSFGGDGTGTKFRRARLFFQGQFFRRGFFKVEYDFSNSGDDGGTEFTDVYAGISLARFGLFRIGHFKEPLSLQYLGSSNFQSFAERAGLQAFSPQRNTGMMLNGNFLVRDSTYAIGFFRRSDDVGEGFSSKEDYRVTSRITFLPYFEDGGERLLHLEFGYSHQFSDENEGTRYRSFAGTDFSPNVVDTGTLPVSDVELFNLGLAVVEGSFSLQGEVSLTVPHDGINQDPVFWGSYAQVSWWLTGERRRYLRGRGVFSRVVPKNRFDPAKDQWGAFEVATRLSWLDLSNDGIRGGTLGEWAVAFNWVLFSNLRMTNNYILSRVGDRPGSQSGLAHSWVTRFQLDF